MSTPASTSLSMAPTLWADLPPDLLGDVSGRLHDPVDFTRFHAVCTAWRDSLTASRRPTLLPGLLTLTACKGHVLHSSVIFSPERTNRRLTYYRRSFRDILLARPPGASPASRNWLASAKGTDALLLTTTDAGAGLVNLLTGAFTSLQAYDEKMRQMENPRGIVYVDGTLFLYSFAYESSSRLAFTAAILRPGDVTWTPVKTLVGYSPYIAGSFGRVAASYHDGKILLCVNLDYWCILTPDDDGASRKLEPTTCVTPHSRDR